MATTTSTQTATRMGTRTSMRAGSKSTKSSKSSKSKESVSHEEKKNELPPVEHERLTRVRVSAPIDHPYSLFETIRYYTGTDRDLIWGPFYKRFRANRRQRANWEDFSLDGIWKGIPAAAQTRPGFFTRTLNYLMGLDPPPHVPDPMPVMLERARTGATSIEDPMGSSKSLPSPTSATRRKTTINTWKDAFANVDDWSPARIDFTEWHGRIKHPADYDDFFYRTNYEVLYTRLCDFAETWFGCGMWLADWRDSDEKISMWEVPMTEQFIQYARAVAHEDHGYIEWGEMLNDPKHRKWLCVGILGQILERRVFESLLFGAGEKYQHELDRHDMQWAGLEGFSRKEGRRQIARAALNNTLVPSRFWDAVDDLAGQTVLIFQPLFMLMCLATGKMVNREAATFWQEIHTIIALAGYFQVCTSISPSIFHFLSATPGARYQYEDEAHADKEMYEASRLFHRSHEDRWRKLAEMNAKNEMQQVQSMLQSLSSTEASLYNPLPRNEDEYRVMDHQRRRGGKVMYAVFPKLTRYTAENIGQIVPVTRGMTQELRMTAEGMRITTLARCQVVYYQGLMHPPKDEAEHNGQFDGVTLESHLKGIARKRMYSIFPYRQRYWAADGTPTSGLHWPIWPEYLDKFWMYWLIAVALSAVYNQVLGSFYYSSGGIWSILQIYYKLVFPPFNWHVKELVLFLGMRAFDVRYFQGSGYWTYFKIRGLNIFLHVISEFLMFLRARHFRPFAYFITLFRWLDLVIFGLLPPYFQSYLRLLGDEMPGIFTAGGYFGGSAASDVHAVVA